MFLRIKNLSVKADAQEILAGISLVLAKGKVYVLLGPNGSGKSTLACVLAGHPHYQVSAGEVWLNGQNLLKMTPEERSRAGLFLAFQNPVEVPGVSVFEFLRAIYQRQVSIDEFSKIVKPILAELNIKESFLERNLHEGFSGGEKKKLEILQLLVLKPKVIILDEIDSGLDVDTLQTITKVIAKFRSNSIILLITHYPRIFKYLRPDLVHLMVAGRVVQSGGFELARRIEREGYQGLNLTA